MCSLDRIAREHLYSVPKTQSLHGPAKEVCAALPPLDKSPCRPWTRLGKDKTGKPYPAPKINAVSGKGTRVIQKCKEPHGVIAMGFA